MKDSPGGSKCHFIKTRTKCYLTTFWVIAWLLSCFLMDLQYVYCVGGGEGINTICLKVQGEYVGLLTSCGPGRSQVEIWSTSNNVLSESESYSKPKCL